MNGTVEIQSKPMGGTTVHVRVPLRSEQASQRAAGVKDSAKEPASNGNVVSAV